MPSSTRPDPEQARDKTQNYVRRLGYPELPQDQWSSQRVVAGQAVKVNINGPSLYSEESVSAVFGAALRIPAVALVGGMRLGVADLRPFRVPGTELYSVGYRDHPGEGAVFRKPVLLIDMDHFNLMHQRGQKGVQADAVTHFGKGMPGAQRFGETLESDDKIGYDHLQLGLSSDASQMVLRDTDSSGVTLIQAIETEPGPSSAALAQWLAALAIPERRV